MTNQELKSILQDAKASVIFEMEQAQYLEDTRKATELMQLMDEIDIAIGVADANSFSNATVPITTINPRPTSAVGSEEFDYLDYLHSKIKL